MSSPATLLPGSSEFSLAAFLRAQRSSISRRWIVAVRQHPKIPSAKALTDEQLQDHLPSLFHDLVDLLEGHPAEGEMSQHAEAHGQHRWEQSYRLVEVCRELSLLCRLVISEGLHAWARSTPERTPEEVHRAEQTILEFFEESLAGSVRQYTRRQHEQMHEMAEQRKLAMDSAGLGWWHYDLLSDRVNWDERFRAIFGVSDQELSYAKVISLMHPEDQARVETAVAAALRPEDPVPYRLEYRVRLENGGVRWVLARGEATFREVDGARQAVSFSGTILDITEARSAQQTLRATEERHRLAIEGAQMGTFTWELPTRRVLWNDRMKELFFLPPETEMSFELGLASLHPDDREPTRAAVRAAIAGHGRYEIEYRSISPIDGAIRWMAATGRAFADESTGEVTHVHGVAIDITEQKRITEELRVSEEKYRSLFDSIDEAFGVVEVLWDANGEPYDYRFLEVNASFTKHTGWPDARGMTARELIPNLEQHWPETYGHVARTGEARRFVQGAAGMGRIFDAYAFRIGTAERPLVALLFRDVTAARQAEDAMREAMAQTEAASRAKDEFLATLSHELRTPLSAILGWTQLMLGDASNSEDVQQGLATIERNARAQNKIIEDLLDMSRIISGKVRLQSQRLDLGRLVQGAVETIQPTAIAKGIELTLQVEERTCSIQGDSDRLQQVLWNLLSNAVKFTPREGKVIVSLERVDSHWQVRVADTGEGIAPEFLPYVFDRFRQQDASTTRRHGGLGLGLAIVRQLVELHGGRVQVTSDGLDQGSTFQLELPMAALETPAAAKTQLPQTSASGAASALDVIDLSGLRVLVVDDEADARTLVQRLLENAQASVRTAGSAQEALRLFHESPPDLLVSDIGMPIEDGYALIKRVRGLSVPAGGMVPAVALTAYAHTEDRLRCLRAGFQMHVAKPVDAQELLTVVASLALSGARR